MEFPELWGTPGKAAVMLCIVEDGSLGDGQKTEKAMAESMGMTRIEIHVKSWQYGEKGALESDRALDAVRKAFKKANLI